MPFHLGQEATKADLKRETFALALSETLQMMTKTQEALVNRDEKWHLEKEVTTVTFIDLTKQAIEVQKMKARPSCLRRRTTLCLPI
jgi:hypothetical protein